MRCTQVTAVASTGRRIMGTAPDVSDETSKSQLNIRHSVEEGVAFYQCISHQDFIGERNLGLVENLTTEGFRRRFDTFRLRPGCGTGQTSDHESAIPRHRARSN